MSKDRIDLSRGNGKTVLDQLLAEWDLDYMGFAKVLGLKTESLWRYRVGQREFRLSMRQIHTLEAMLKRIGLSLSELPEDWILDDPKKDE